MKTKDIDIRKKLHDIFNKKYSNDMNTLIIDEFNLCQGLARIDIVIINEQIHGYEIKSETDNLLRLPNQIDIYNKVMNKMTVVTGENHYEKIKELVPDWWEIKVVVHNKNGFRLITKKRGRKNKNINPYSLTQLLWKNEAIEILTKNGLEKGIKSKPKKIIWEKLASSLSLKELQSEVINAIKNRRDWKVH